MPPKGSKRTSKGAPPEAKRLKASSPEQECVREALTKAVSLTPDVRSMLSAMLPHALGVLSEDRDERQRMVVGMFEETIYGIREELKSSLEAASNQVSEADAAKVTLAAEAADCEAKLKQRQEAVDAAKVALAARKEAAKTAGAELTRAEASLKALQAGVEEQKQLKIRLEELLAGELKALREGTFADVTEAKRLAASLMKVVTKMEVEDSLTSALQPTCIKAPSERSSFDSMVLEQITTEVKNKASDLGDKLQAAAPALAEQQAAMQAAQGASQAAQADADKGAVSLKEAQQLDSEAKAALAAACRATDGAEPAIDKARKAHAAAQAALTTFEGGAVRSFEALRDQKKPEPELEPVAVVVGEGSSKP